MDEPYHEPWCDRDHTPRQRCNRALAPDSVIDETGSRNGVSTTADSTPPGGTGTDDPSPAETAPPPVSEFGEPPEKDTPSLQREVAVATDMPRASPYATEEWERTEQRLSDDAPAPSATAATPPASAARERRAQPTPVAILAALALAIVLWRLLRRSPGRTPQG